MSSDSFKKYMVVDSFIYKIIVTSYSCCIKYGDLCKAIRNPMMMNEQQMFIRYLASAMSYWCCRTGKANFCIFQMISTLFCPIKVRLQSTSYGILGTEFMGKWNLSVKPFIASLIHLCLFHGENFWISHLPVCSPAGIWPALINPLTIDSTFFCLLLVLARGRR